MRLGGRVEGSWKEERKGKSRSEVGREEGRAGKKGERRERE